jgi:hypothetical protein
MQMVICQLVIVYVMEAVRYTAQLALKLEPSTRRALELIAENEKKSLGEVARELLDAAIQARGDP